MSTFWMNVIIFFWQHCCFLQSFIHFNSMFWLFLVRRLMHPNNLWLIVQRTWWAESLNSWCQCHEALSCSFWNQSIFAIKTCTLKMLQCELLLKHFWWDSYLILWHSQTLLQVTVNFNSYSSPKTPKGVLAIEQDNWFLKGKHQNCTVEYMAEATFRGGNQWVARTMAHCSFTGSHECLTYVFWAPWSLPG